MLLCNACTIQQQRDKEVSELRLELASKKEDEKQAPSTRPVTMWTWQSPPDVPADMVFGSSVVIGDKTYFKSFHGKTVFEFSNNQWNKLPSRPNSRCTIVNVDNVLTTVGGVLGSYSNKLHSYIDNQWIEHFSPIPTKRRNPAAVYANNTLVVAGGHNAECMVNHSRDTKHCEQTMV